MIKKKKLLSGSATIWVVFLLLSVVSLLEVFSAGSTLAYRNGSYMAPLLRQAAFLLAGFVIMIAVHRVPPRFFKIVPVIGYPICLALLVGVKLYGGAVNGAQRWVQVSAFSFQPSELAKGILVITVALILSVQQTNHGAKKDTFKYILWATLPIVGMIFMDNVSTAALLFGVVFLMMIIGRVSKRQLLKLVGVIALAGAVGGTVLWALPDDASLSSVPGMGRLSTVKSRLATKFGHEEVLPKDYDLDKNNQIAHARIAIATSNYVGKGVGNSVERDFLSQAYSDFIYAIIVEETGVIGAVLVLGLFLFLYFQVAWIVSRCDKLFPAFLVIGLALLMVSQAMLNMMVAVGLFPVTGQPLPLISRGGTSILITSLYFGIILSVSNSVQCKERVGADEEVATEEELEDGEEEVVVEAVKG